MSIFDIFDPEPKYVTFRPGEALPKIKGVNKRTTTVFGTPAGSGGSVTNKLTTGEIPFPSDLVEGGTNFLNKNVVRTKEELYEKIARQIRLDKIMSYVKFAGRWLGGPLSVAAEVYAVDQASTPLDRYGLPTIQQMTDQGMLPSAAKERYNQMYYNKFRKAPYKYPMLPSMKNTPYENFWENSL